MCSAIGFDIQDPALDHRKFDQRKAQSNHPQQTDLLGQQTDLLEPGLCPRGEDCL